jgi:hypothetical protein
MLKLLKRIDASNISFQAIHQDISFIPNSSGIVAFHSHSKGSARISETRKSTHRPEMKYAIADEILSTFIVQKLKTN